MQHFMRFGKVVLCGAVVGGLAVILIVGNRPTLEPMAALAERTDLEFPPVPPFASSNLETSGLTPPPPLVPEAPPRHEIARASYDDPVEDLDAFCGGSPERRGTDNSSSHTNADESAVASASGYDPKSAFPTDEVSESPRPLPWPTPASARPAPLAEAVVDPSPSLPSIPAERSAKPKPDVEQRFTAAVNHADPVVATPTWNDDQTAVVPSPLANSPCVVAPADGMNRAVAAPQQCVVRDPETQQAVLTLTIPRDVRSTPIDPEKLAARRAADRRAQNESHSARPSVDDVRGGEASPVTAGMHIRQLGESGAVEIAANNVELGEALRRLAEYTDRPIYASPSVRGTFTAEFQATDMLQSLQRLLEPFGFAVIAESDRIIVRSAGEHFNGDHARPVLATDPVRPQAYPRTPFPEPRAFETPGRVESAGTIAVAVASGVNAAHLPERETAKMDPPQHIPPAVRLASAEAALPPPSEAADPQTRPLENGEAIVLIAQMAQDAFAADQEEYGLAILQEGIARYPECVLLRRLLGEGHLVRHELQAAEEVLRSALELDKHDGKLNELMGTTLVEMGQKQRGSHYLLQAKSLGVSLK